MNFRFLWLNSLWRHRFRWCQHFFVDISKTLKFEYLANRLSQKDGWPLDGKLRGSRVQKMRYDGPSMVNVCWSQHFLRKKWENDVTRHKMTSPCRIFTKLAGFISLTNTKLWCKYEVISVFQTKIMNIFLFPALIWKYIGKLHLLRKNDVIREGGCRRWKAKGGKILQVKC